MKTVIELGVVLRARRKKLKLTQSELAMTCGTGIRFIGDLERGKPTCQIGKVLEVIQTLGLRIALDDKAQNVTQGVSE
ncbi:MAG: helix-turn-helix transcriptional regulator [Lentisphaerae bacterium]|nr:helix-turn-helix transcriptional regulator [Lentisphaerota bacterium]